ncbi:MAG: hypothetical protein PHN93_11235, partial [Sphaerochaetaceae bacterium]|nr:hypothetical protein [Sphaerochaetaceae bacterium]
MTEEDKKPKATLIKHARGPAGPSNPSQAPHEAESSRPAEKKKVVVVKKKVVVVRPQAKPIEKPTAPAAEDSASSSTVTQAATEPSATQATVSVEESGRVQPQQGSAGSPAPAQPEEHAGRKSTDHPFR